MSNICVFMVAVNGYADKFAENIWRNHEWAWARGYVFRLITIPASLLRNDCGWLKLAVAEQLLRKYRTVFSVDADARIMSTCPVLESVIDDKHELYMCQGKTYRLNSGVVIYHHGFPSSTLEQAFQELFGVADEEVPAEHIAPQENGHVIWRWRNWPTLGLLDGRWNQIEPANAYVVHGYDNPAAFKRKTRQFNSHPLWYYEIEKERRHSCRVRVRYYARKLAEIGVI